MIKNFKFKNGKFVICENIDQPDDTNIKKGIASFNDVKNASDLYDLISNRTKMPSVEVERFFDKIFQWGEKNGLKFDSEKFTDEIVGDEYYEKPQQPVSSLSNKQVSDLTDPRVGPTTTGALPGSPLRRGS